VSKFSPVIVGLCFLAVLSGCLTACGANEDVDVDATVQAGIAGTQAAEEQLEAAVSEAVAATLTAMPTPTPLSADQLSEEEFADAVDSSVDEAVQASDQASAATTEAASDGEISDEELEELYYLYYWTLEEVEQAMYLADEYYELYAELLDLTITGLEELETELEMILDTADAVIYALDDISQTLAQGSQLAQEALDNLNQLAGQISANAGSIKERLPDWKETRKQEFGQLLDQALNVVPNDIAQTRVGALTQARDYLQSVQSAVSDGRFSLAELTSISQLGANAAASLSNLGAGDLTGLPDMINGLTGSFARGGLPEVNLGLGLLQNSLPSIR
jgi:uncharacterized phage infection (PIP) family protein YhgE